MTLHILLFYGHTRELHVNEVTKMFLLVSSLASNKHASTAICAGTVTTTTATKNRQQKYWVNCNARTTCTNSSGVKPGLGLDQDQQ